MLLFYLVLLVLLFLPCFISVVIFALFYQCCYFCLVLLMLLFRFVLLVLLFLPCFISVVILPCFISVVIFALFY